MAAQLTFNLIILSSQSLRFGTLRLGEESAFYVFCLDKGYVQQRIFGRWLQ